MFGIFGCRLAPLIAAALFAATGITQAISVYVIVITIISFVAVFLLGETYRKDIGDVQEQERKLVT